MPSPRWERRRTLRLEMPFSILVRGINTHASTFTLQTVLDNISRGGLHLVLSEAVDPGAKLFLVVDFSRREGAPGACVALRGRVVRVEPHRSDTRGVAVALTHYRFL